MEEKGTVDQKVGGVHKVRNYVEKKIVIKNFLLALILYGIFLLIGSLFFLDKLIYGFSNNYSTIFGSLIQVSGGLLGFVITGLSILTVASNKSFMKEYKNSGLLDELVSLFKVTIYILGFDTLVFIIFLMIDTTDYLVLLLISLWLIFLSTFFIIRCIQVMVKLTTINIIYG